MGTNAFHRRAASSSYPAWPCSLTGGGHCNWGPAEQTTWPADAWETVSQRNQAAIRASALLAAPCAFWWLTLLGEDLPVWVWSWQPTSSWCLERTNPKRSPREWLGGGNAGQLSIVVFFFVVYEITAVPHFFRKHWKCLSFISLIYLKHNAVRGKYCYFMILVTHVVLKLFYVTNQMHISSFEWVLEKKKKAPNW